MGSAHRGAGPGVRTHEDPMKRCPVLLFGKFPNENFQFPSVYMRFTPTKDNDWFVRGSLVMSQSQKSPLTRLVLFMVCLSIAGSIVAGAHYFAVDLPQQKAVQAPSNSPSDNCQECYDRCDAEFPNSGGCKYNCLIYVCRK